MQCIRPINATFDKKGKLTFKYDTTANMKGIVPFQFPCRKCLPCRLNIAREKAIRCYHESKMHKDNIFLTLTYNDENLSSPELQYEDFQKFMKKLRKTRNEKINYIVTGEYGELNKRPHWHAIIFNYWPQDYKKLRTTDLQHEVYHSETLDKIWNKGNTEFGNVTMDSANYVARYAAKKLVHGKDQEHNYHPIHKTSSKNAIGKKWIELNYKHTFDNGFVVLQNGETAKIPRYYEDWLKKNKPDYWTDYVTNLKQDIISKAEIKARKEEIAFLSNLITNKWTRETFKTKKSNVQLTILNRKFKQLQENLKL